MTSLAEVTMKKKELQPRVQVYHPYKLVTFVLTKSKCLLTFKTDKHVKRAPAELRSINSQQYCMHYKGVHLLLVQHGIACLPPFKRSLRMRSNVTSVGGTPRWEVGDGSEAQLCTLRERENSLSGQIFKGQVLHRAVLPPQFRFVPHWNRNLSWNKRTPLLNP